MGGTDEEQEVAQPAEARQLEGGQRENGGSATVEPAPSAAEQQSAPQGGAEEDSGSCAQCGTSTSGIPMCYRAPAPWRQLVEDESQFDERVGLTDDLCVVDKEHFFIRGHIEIPVTTDCGGEPTDTFVWSVWCSLSRESFDQVLERWEDPDRDQSPANFGWLSSELPYAETTMNLKTLVHQRKPGEVPTVELEPTNHPLAVEQRAGISLERVEEHAQRMGSLDEGRAP